MRAAEAWLRGLASTVLVTAAITAVGLLEACGSVNRAQKERDDALQGASESGSKGVFETDRVFETDQGVVPLSGEQANTKTQKVRTNSEAPDVFPPERRKEQKQTTPGHLLTPLAANIPGVGFAYGVAGGAFNLLDTESDVMGFRFWGDLAGIGAGAMDVPLWRDILVLNAFVNTFERVGIETNRRGINSDHNDAKVVELDLFNAYIAQLNLKLLERRLILLAGVNRQESSLASIRDRDGKKLVDGNSDKTTMINRSSGVFVDLADDRSDPRRGLQAEAYRYDKPSAGAGQAEFYQMEYNFTYYTPVLDYSVFALNLYKSDAHVTGRGELDASKVREQTGLNCDGFTEDEARTRCQTETDSQVKEKIAQNKYGTAAPLGGTQRLRSYVTGRFAAAHSLFAGGEFRWNLTEEFTPFNIFVASGVRTGVQLALFGEGGTVSDQESMLLDDWRYSYGGGLRFILASGFVVRLDVATGDEGTQPTLIFQYPWSVF